MPSRQQRLTSFAALCAVLFSVISGCEKRPVSTYRPAKWSELPQISDADWIQGFKVWQEGCAKLSKSPGWESVCSMAPDILVDAATVRLFLQRNFQLFALRHMDKKEHGLITGYYEPLSRGSRERTALATAPVYGIPDDLLSVQLGTQFPELSGRRIRGRLKGKNLVPYFSSAEIARMSEKGKFLDAPILAWAAPMDLHVIQVQGSGRLLFDDGEEIRLGYGDQNGHAYRSVRQWLVKKRELPPEEATMPTIRAWAAANPTKVTELLASNPSYIFFRQMEQRDGGPIGSWGSQLTSGYSAAVDRGTIPLGSPLILQTTTPEERPLQRFIVAHDTGGAIRGPVRVDLFFGLGEEAGEIAGCMRQRGRLWLIWPKGTPLPGDRPSG